MSSSDRNNNTDHGSYAYDFTALAAFTSGDAHNGCRALFNGTAGWAFFGPAGFIDPKALPPGTESYPCDFKARGKRASTCPSRPGEGLGRKTNDARSAYLDAEDLRHLVRGTSEADADADGDGDGAGGGEEAPRKGRPIVLTLQAILAAASPASPAAAAAIEAAAAVAAAGARAEDYERARRQPESAGPPPPAVADRAQFPPLLLRGASADKGPGLFLAPPITMVKNSPAEPVELRPDAEAGMQSDGGGGGGGRVSCSEAVAATSVAEAAAHGGDGGGGGDAGAVAGGGGMSRIGWWLRWATTSGGADSAAGANANDDGGGGVVSLETSTGADGWQVVSSPVPGAPAAAMAVEVPPAAVSNSDDEAGSWCDFAAEGEVDVGEVDGAPVVPLAVRDAAGERGAGAPAVAIEDALKRAAGGTIYDDGSSFAGEDDVGEEAFEEENSTVAYSAAGDDDGDDSDDNDPSAMPQVVSPNVPRSFRDTLMAPSASGAVGFSDSTALLRARASTASLSASPTLVDGGADGGAVFLWRKAAAGEGRPDRSKGPIEDEDPYYARKRVGAFAFKTKPRGKAHK